MSATLSAKQEWLSIKDAAEHCRVSTSLVRKWIKDGLPSLQPAGSRRRIIQREDLERWVRGETA